MNKYWNYK